MPPPINGRGRPRGRKTDGKTAGWMYTREYVFALAAGNRPTAAARAVAQEYGISESDVFHAVSRNRYRLGRMLMFYRLDGGETIADILYSGFGRAHEETANRLEGLGYPEKAQLVRDIDICGMVDQLVDRLMDDLGALYIATSRTGKKPSRR